MPKEKESKHKHLLEWRMFERDNLGSQADIKKIKSSDLKYICMFRDKKFVKPWVELKGDQSKVYIVELWIDNKRINRQTTHTFCDICNIIETYTRSFAQKWCWDNQRKWHASNYVHQSENC